MTRIMLIVLLAACGAYAQEELPFFIREHLQNRIGSPTVVMVQLPDPSIAPPPAQRGQIKLSFDHVEPCGPTCYDRIYVKIEGKNGPHIVAVSPGAKQLMELKLLNDDIGMVTSFAQEGSRVRHLHELVKMDTGEIMLTLSDEPALGITEQVVSPSGRYLMIAPPPSGYSAMRGLPQRHQGSVAVYDLHDMAVKSLKDYGTNERNPFPEAKPIYVALNRGPAVPLAPNDRLRRPPEYHIVHTKWLDTDVIAEIDEYPSGEIELTVSDFRQAGAYMLVRNELLNNYCPSATAGGQKLEFQDIAHVPETDTLNVTLAPCGKLEVHVPGLQ